MAAQTLEALIEREFQEAEKTREDLLAKRREIDDQLAALERRLQAAVNYKATLEGKFSHPQRKPRALSSGRAQRGDRAKLKEQILDLVRSLPDGATAESINSELQATDPKSKQKIANVLSLMKNEGVLTQAARRGPYKLAAA